MEINFQLGRTVNVGNFNSIKYSYGITMDTDKKNYKKDMKKLEAEVSSWCKKMDKKIKDEYGL